MNRWASVLVVLVMATPMSWAGTILVDTFDVSSSSNDINYEISSRQSGSLTTTSWVDNDLPSNDRTQVGNNGFSGKLYMEPSTALNTNSYLWASPNKNFASFPQITVTVDMTPGAVISSGTEIWTALVMGNSTGAWVTEGLTFLLRANGEYLVNVPGDGWIASGTLSAGSHRIVADLRQDGTQSLYSVSADGNSLLTDYAVTKYTVNANYVTLGANGEDDANLPRVVSTFDNFKVEAIPEPVTLALMGMAFPLFLGRKSR